jgi:hypothetical protein
MPLYASVLLQQHEFPGLCEILRKYFIVLIFEMGTTAYTATHRQLGILKNSVSSFWHKSIK